MNKITIAVAAAIILIVAAGVIIIRMPAPPAPAAQTESKPDTEGLSRAMTFTSPAEPKK
ncbi:hypothetical protein V5F77_16645 [Xanthobacter sp. DSM 24535]|uniref:hypothetical protein n=1 Tax=Roseixanthobacter psychrophilus TaxID=3119917 RepID=UPI0037281B25